MDSDLSIMLLRTVFIYFFVLVTMRLMGKREIGKLSVFDFVVSIIIAEIAVFAIEDPKMPLIEGIAPIILLMLIQVFLSYLSLKSKRIRDLVDGRSTVIIENGNIKDKEMKKLRYNFDDLMIQLREKNITNIADVEFAILEPTGKLSVIQKPEKMPVTREDLGLRKAETSLPLPLIVDGHVLDENLEKLDKNRLWLKQRLKKIGTTDFKKIMYASIDEYGNLFIDVKDY